MVSLKSVGNFGRMLLTPAAYPNILNSLRAESYRQQLRRKQGGKKYIEFLAKQNPVGVSLRYWDADNKDGSGNFGDLLSPLICEHFVRTLCNSELNAPATRITPLYAVGSLLQAATEDAVVWGTGYEHTLNISSPRPDPSKHRLDIRAVRGPLTAAALRNLGYSSPAVYGDPAILMPLLYQPQLPPTDTWDTDTLTKPSAPAGNGASQAPRKVLIIQHHNGSNLPAALALPHADLAARPNTAWRTPALKTDDNIIVAVSAWTAYWQELIDLIASADLVISSGLHGIIVAEAYGVPAIRVVDNKIKASIKFEDYYLSTGRIEYARADNIQQALTYPAPPLPKLQDLQQALLDAFPRDLWTKQ